MANVKEIHLVLLLVAFLVAASPVSAFWRLLCHGQVDVVRIDPLTDFGMISDHAHAVHGANNFSFTATVDDLMASDCTSCSITQDRSAYWTPPLYFEDDNGNFTLVPQKGGMTVYYFNNKAPGENITAFPKGFSMISGDTRQRNFTLPIPDPPTSFWTANDTTQSALAQKAIGFNCLNYTSGFATEGSLLYHYIRNKTFTDEECPDGLRLELMFPSCWNGRDLTSENHKSHIQFPELVQTGDCPDGFPVRMPVLFYETIFDIKLFKDYSGRFVIANGDFEGHGYHGDFIAGWDPEFLQEVLNVCNSSTGLQEDCPLFNLQDDSNATACTMNLPEPLQDDDTRGPRISLPGDHPIYTGPAYAPPCVGSPLPSDAGVSAPPMIASSSDFSVLVTIPPTSPVSALADPSIYSTTTYTSDGTDVVMVVAVQEVTVTAEVTVTETGSAMKRHLARHHHYHG